jgi:hypothetical protein
MVVWGGGGPRPDRPVGCGWHHLGRDALGCAVGSMTEEGRGR